MQNVVIQKNNPVKDFATGVLSVRGPEPPPPPLLHTVPIRVYQYTYSHKEGGGESSTREKARGTTVHKAGSIIPT
jgi:hypothetical protein